MSHLTTLEQQVKLLDLLDRILTKGVDIIDAPPPSSHSNLGWIYIGLEALLDFTKTAEQLGKEMRRTRISPPSKTQTDPLTQKNVLYQCALNMPYEVH